MKFSEIPQLPRARYQVNVDWHYLEATLERWLNPEAGMAKLNLDPDFQRAHVWTVAQQTAYIEYMLQGGEVGRTITFNHTGWGGSYRGTFEVVDGKQRLEAVRAFLHDEVLAFGLKYSQFEGRLNSDHNFLFHVTQLKTRAEILQLYLNINAGGTPHTEEELDRVRTMLARETSPNLVNILRNLAGEGGINTERYVEAIFRQYTDARWDVLEEQAARLNEEQQEAIVMSEFEDMQALVAEKAVAELDAFLNDVFENLRLEGEG